MILLVVRLVWLSIYLVGRNSGHLVVHTSDLRKMAYIPFKFSCSLSHYVSSITSKGRVKQTELTRWADNSILHPQNNTFVWIFSVLQPEWYFTHVLNVVHEHRPFMESVIQRILSLTKYRNVNAWVRFVSICCYVIDLFSSLARIHPPHSPAAFSQTKPHSPISTHAAVSLCTHHISSIGFWRCACRGWVQPFWNICWQAYRRRRKWPKG